MVHEYWGVVHNLNPIKIIQAQLKKSAEWTCETAANSKTGKASDCDAILAKSTGIGYLTMGRGCCYKWTGYSDHGKDAHIAGLFK